MCTLHRAVFRAERSAPRLRVVRELRFAENYIDASVLRDLTDQDLSKIGTRRYYAIGRP